MMYKCGIIYKVNKNYIIVLERNSKNRYIYCTRSVIIQLDIKLNLYKK